MAANVDACMVCVFLGSFVQWSKRICNVFALFKFGQPETICYRGTVLVIVSICEVRFEPVSGRGSWSLFLCQLCVIRLELSNA